MVGARWSTCRQNNSSRLARYKPALSVAIERMSPLLLRVSDAGQRHRHDIHQWPVSESRQGKNPRGMGRGECRALRYGDLADAEGVSAGAPCPLRRVGMLVR